MKRAKQLIESEYQPTEYEMSTLLKLLDYPEVSTANCVSKGKYKVEYDGGKEAVLSEKEASHPSIGKLVEALEYEFGGTWKAEEVNPAKCRRFISITAKKHCLSDPPKLYRLSTTPLDSINGISDIYLATFPGYYATLISCSLAGNIRDTGIYSTPAECIAQLSGYIKGFDTRGFDPESN